jgi:hypothetical protein
VLTANGVALAEGLDVFTLRTTTIGVTRLQSGRRSFGKKELSLDRCLGLETSHGVIASAEDLPEGRKRAVPLFNYNMASALQLNTITEILSRLPNVTLQSCKHDRRVNGNPRLACRTSIASNEGRRRL